MSIKSFTLCTKYEWQRQENIGFYNRLSTNKSVDLNIEKGLYWTIQYCMHIVPIFNLAIKMGETVLIKHSDTDGKAIWLCTDIHNTTNAHMYPSINS